MRVVWNFRHVANNLLIGGWQTVVSPEHMKMEIVEGLYACVEGNAMQAKRYRENRQKSSSDSERDGWKGLEKELRRLRDRRREIKRKIMSGI